MAGFKPDIHFRLMAFGFWFRDLFNPPENKLREAGINPGERVLDFGCGPGSYSLAAARMVGESGEVYALDIHPLAIKSVTRKALRKGLRNIISVFPDNDSPFQDKCLDVILLYDVFHEVKAKDKVMTALYRMLCDNGVLSFSDHHLGEKEIVDAVTQGGYFKLVKKGKKTYTFKKVTPSFEDN
jgi:ubiquinone/menaquinone biosynthesis C-methylase UbiE